MAVAVRGCARRRRDFLSASSAVDQGAQWSREVAGDGRGEGDLEPGPQWTPSGRRGQRVALFIERTSCDPHNAGCAAAYVQSKQGAFEDCCLGYQHRIKWNVLRHARNYHQQEVSGSCNLRAVRFYFRQKVVCGNPEDMNVKRAMRILTARKRLVHWKSASDSQTERKKSNQMKSKVENPNSTSVRSATLGHPRMVMMPRKTNN
uniref:C-C motif chemokine 25 n=1 Tax=Mus spicilegus TaxID=10103 RepID=A0A8C6IKB4_MUSSI